MRWCKKRSLHNFRELFFLNIALCNMFQLTFLKSTVKGPKYATTPEDRSTSPVILSYLSPSTRAASVQRSFSPPSPPISFSARSSFCSQIRMLASNSFFLLVIASNSSFSAWSLSTTFARKEGPKGYKWIKVNDYQTVLPRANRNNAN